MALLFFVFSWLPGLNGQTNTPGPAARSNRYLLIVETSRSMQRRSDGILQAIQALLASNLGGQIRNGDTLGVWTYNEELNPGKLPLQRWSADAPKTVTPRVLAFVKEQKFEKQGRFEKVLPALGHLMRNSELITVLVISDGTEIHGTPFDDRINEVFKTWRTQQQDARMPFVTLLRAYKGKLTDCLVNPAPWVVELPPLPIDWQPMKAVAKPPALPSSKATNSPTLPPLILTGKKPEPPQPVKMADTPTASTTPNAAPPIQNALAAQARTDTAPLTSTAVPPSAADIPAAPTLAGKKTEVQANIPPLSQKTPESATKPKDSSSALTPAVEPNAPPSASSGLAEKAKQTPKTEAAPSTQTPVEVATVSQKSSFFSAPIFWAVFFGVVAIIIGSVWLWRSRSRPPEPSSLITQSFDQDRK